MGDARHSRGYGKWQAQHGANRQCECSTHKQVQVVTRGLLQIVGGPVHNHRCQILIQVAQDRESDRGQNRISNAPRWEGAVDARRIHNPWPLAAIGQNQTWGEFCVHLQHPQVGLTGVQGGPSRSGHQGDRYREVGREVPDKSQGPRLSSECGQPCGKSESVEEQQCLEHGAHKRHPLLREILDDWPHSIDDEDERDQSSEDVFRKHGDVLHERAQVEDGDQDSEQGAPHASPEVEGHELHVDGDGQVVDDKRVGQEGARSSENRQGLTSCTGEDHPTDGSRHDHLQHTKLAVGAIEEPAAEGDRRGQGGYEQIQDG
mmetsp:Transcript_9482/g.20299  ORF Transcript_9482/g.20299 Transcript_9482/m.20299 type:complete len:317 (-) Transcript_9482:200-1150(-)